MEHIQPYLDYFSAHPDWALVIVFLIAFGEALLIIGLFVPSTAVLVGAGMLVGTGHLDFWPVFIATAVGAIAGDQISYWAGRLFGERLKTMWPLNRYPALVVKGENYVREHGGKSIAVGRFIPGIKAVVPGIVGMLGMNQAFFVFVNFTSGIVWALAHVMPGVLLGQGLALAGEISGRLVIVLLVLVAIMAVAGWLMRLLAAGISPYLHRLLRRLSAWARSYNNRPMQRLGRAIAPENPRSMLLLLFVFILLGAVLALSDLIAGLVLRDAVSNLDQSIVALMAELRNAPADALMVGISLLSDDVVVWSLAGAMALWLFFWRAWRAGTLLLVLMLCGNFLVSLLGKLVQRPAPVPGLSVIDGTFPSGHTLMAGLALGLLAVLSSHAMGRWSKAVVAATCGCLVVAVAFSRVYLGADWLSDVVGGILIAALLSALFGMIIEAIPSRRIRPLGLLGFAMLATLASGAYHLERNHDEAVLAYAVPDHLQIEDLQTWLGDGRQSLPSRRVDLAGQPEEQFAAIWMGDSEKLKTMLSGSGWKEWAGWQWKDSLSYIDSSSSLEALPPRPLLHQGLRARLTMSRGGQSAVGRRQVMRLFKTQSVVRQGGVDLPVYLISVTPEILRKRLFLLDMPSTQPVDGADVANLLSALGQTPAVKTVVPAGQGSPGIPVFMPAS